MNQFEPSPIATDAAVRDAFLATLREVGTLAAAYRATGVAKSTLSRLRRHDRDFDAACAAVIGAATTDALEAALLARAIHGVERVKTHANGTVVRWREFDNRLAFDMLKKRQPNPYGDLPTAAAPPRPVMTRAEFIAAIRMRPRLDAPESTGEAEA
jgi:hypothetical protein